MSTLRRISGFLPYLTVVFLNAFIDFGHKTVIQNTIFKTWSGQEQVVLSAILNGLMLLPFILLFSPAGFVADRFARPRIIQHAALAAVITTLAITFCYYQGWFWGAFVLTLALTVQSAIYSPAKYGYIKDLVGQQHLANANGTVQAVTVGGLLLGILVFSILFESLLGRQTVANAGAAIVVIAPIGWGLVALSLLEWLISWRLPASPQGDQKRHFEMRQYVTLRHLRNNLALLGSERAIKLSIVGLATFWAISQILLTTFPAFAKETLGVTNMVAIQGVLASLGIGFIIGSVIAGRSSRNYIETGLLPVAALGIALGIVFLPGLDSLFSMTLSFLLIGIMGGIFIVPLNALMQFKAQTSSLGTVLAGNNWMQTLAMLGALVLATAVTLAGIDSASVLHALILIAIIGTGYTLIKLPHSMARIIATAVLKRRYRLDVVGFENLPPSGAALLLGNHISWIDWALVQIACPRPVRFVIRRRIYNLWYLKPIFKLLGAVAVTSEHSDNSVAKISQLLQDGECVCLFPEGAISRNGNLGTFNDGYQRMVEGVKEGVIVPFYLHGLWGSHFSRAEEGLRGRRAPATRRDLIVAFGKPLPLQTDADHLKQKVFELSITAWDTYSDHLDSVPLAILRKCRRQRNRIVAINSTGEKLTGRRFAAATACFAGAIPMQRKQPNIGIMLPASSAAAIALVAVSLKGKVAVQLNYTAGSEAVHAAVDRAELSTVLTSRQFLTRLEERGIDPQSLLPSHVEKVFLEDIRESLPKWKLVMAMVLHSLLPSTWFYRLYGKRIDTEQPLAILFSSGSESAPKGVVLSHRNVMCNIKQVSDVLNTRVDDVMMSCLPPFHSFGLTVTTLLPLVEGIPMVCHPDPTDSLGVAKAVATYQATLLLGTSTFLSFYSRNRKVHPLMLESLRIVVSGAEKLSERVREEFESKFQRPIYEGYGATETTPVASVNIPDAIDTTNWRVQQGSETGSVGMPLPGTCFRIVNPETLEPLEFGEDGLILISGNQVMLGYLKDQQRTDQVIREFDGLRWYITGDKGHVNEAGFLVIVDRYSRFAKVAGEMVSLTRVEQIISDALDNNEVELAATVVPDSKRGEKIVLLACGFEGIEQAIERAIATAEIDPLLRPAHILTVEDIPKLGSGKLDLSRLKHVAEAALT